MIFDSKGKMHQTQEQLEAAEREYSKPAHIAKKESDSTLLGAVVFIHLIIIPLFFYLIITVMGLSLRSNPVFFTWAIISIVSYVGWFVVGYKLVKEGQNFPSDFGGYGLITALSFAGLIGLIQYMFG